MIQEQIKILRNLGFEVSEKDGKGNITISKSTIPDLIVLEKLLLTMTFDEEIHYWDADQKSPTDPGGYVTALCLGKQQVAYMEGNHGWTSKWYIISVEEMAKHIQKNWDKDCDGGKYLNKVQIRTNKYVTREEISKSLWKW